jgi:hypothetical protein
MQRIQTNAECIVLYASQRVELKYVERLMSNIHNSMLIGSISFALINFPIQLLSKLRRSSLAYCTYRGLVRGGGRDETQLKSLIKEKKYHL